jgi:hypothetical protein
MLRVLSSLDISQTPAINKCLYSLSMYWPWFTETLQLAVSDGSSVFGQSFMLTLCSFLSLGAGFSSRVSQMLAEALPNLLPVNELDNQEGAAFCVLLDHLLKTDDRPQIARLTSNLANCPNKGSRSEREIHAMMAIYVLRRRSGPESGDTPPLTVSQTKEILVLAVRKLDPSLTQITAEGRPVLNQDISKGILRREKLLRSLELNLEASLVNLGKPVKESIKRDRDEAEVD